MDVQLPELDGLQATQRIKADPELRPIPLVVVTSYALSGDEAKALAAGADAYVTKPFSPASCSPKSASCWGNLGTMRRGRTREHASCGPFPSAYSR